MSKIYEALRQKEKETSTLPSCAHDGEAVTDGVESVAVKPELDVADEVLQAAVSEAEEERPYDHEFIPQFESASDLTASEPGISPNGFRRLKLAYREESRLVFQTEPDGLAAEQFRFLRRTLEQKFPTGAVLLITSPAPKDGKTLTTLNLCACLADSGRSTLLLEADIRLPAVGKVLGGMNTAPGIEDALAGTVDPSRAVHYVEELSLYVAMVADPPADPSRLVSGTGAKRLLAWAREHFDWVVIDSPPVLPAADVAQLVTLADAVLLVVRAQSTPRELTTRAFELLGNHLYGVVLNEATIESNPYYRYLGDYRQTRAVSGRRGVTSENNGRGSSPAGVAGRAGPVR
jgi:capsular exopolysaccharide synthesis family protein